MYQFLTLEMPTTLLEFGQFMNDAKALGRKLSRELDAEDLEASANTELLAGNKQDHASAANVKVASTYGSV